jgi:hypothetical protein
MQQAGNAISLAFLDPADLPRSRTVPPVFATVASYWKSHGKTVFFSIGGMAYAERWTWLSDMNATASIGKLLATVARDYSVGIEIDYEGGRDPTSGLVSLVTAFRQNGCPIGTCVITMDLYGSPGGQPWQTNTVKALLPSTGKPGQGSGNYLDFVNVMVIDGQPIPTSITFWNQWIASGVLNPLRATFGLNAGWPGLGICQGDSTAHQGMDVAVAWIKQHQAYGSLAWAVCPPAPGQPTTCGDWQPSCNAAAPGLKYLCTKFGSF